MRTASRVLQSGSLRPSTPIRTLLDKMLYIRVLRINRKTGLAEKLHKSFAASDKNFLLIMQGS